SPDGEVLHVGGVIGPRFEADIRKALRRHRGTRALVIDSPGGLRAQAFKVARLVNARGLTVRVERRCASACVLLWAQARSREMAPGARLGLHRSSLETALPIPAALRAELMRRNDRDTDAVLRQAGFPERIVALGAATPPTTMHWFAADELQREGVPFALLEAGPSPAQPIAANAAAGSEAGAAAHAP
ncbi:MAG TPA: hypothetical protein VEY50_01330, partial [Lysobacter sp.]|nr:hypothetical protein [Lysobacter sp.]